LPPDSPKFGGGSLSARPFLIWTRTHLFWMGLGLFHVT
jgi:hypothetical protein